MSDKSLKFLAGLLGLENSSEEVPTSFAFDSRKVEKGALFFALKGERCDGHQFLEEVAASGAMGAVVSKQYSGKDFGLKLIRTDDVLEALHLLAKKTFELRKGKVVAITGSVGKTTAKEFLATLLEEKFSVFKTHLSENSRITLPIQLLSLEQDHEVYVLEMAMTEPGQIERLAWIAPPELAMVTVIAPAHIAFFSEGVEGIAKAKAEIFSQPNTEVGVLGPSAARFDELLYAGSCPKVIYGSDLWFDGDRIVEKGGETSPAMPLQFSASHLRENFLGAAAIARLFGMSWEEIAGRADLLKPFSNRFELVEERGVTFVRDCYNSNTFSMQAAFENVPLPNGGRRIGVFGSMESAPNELERHREMGVAALKVFDELLCIGKECASMVDVYLHAGKKATLFSSLAEMKVAMDEKVKTGDVVLIKASNRMQLWELF